MTRHAPNLHNLVGQQSPGFSVRCHHFPLPYRPYELSLPHYLAICKVTQALGRANRPESARIGRMLNYFLCISYGVGASANLSILICSRRPLSLLCYSKLAHWPLDGVYCIIQPLNSSAPTLHSWITNSSASPLDLARGRHYQVFPPDCYLSLLQVDLNLVYLSRGFLTDCERKHGFAIVFVHVCGGIHPMTGYTRGAFPSTFWQSGRFIILLIIVDLNLANLIVPLTSTVRNGKSLINAAPSTRID